jgi:hypothetical protein
VIPVRTLCWVGLLIGVVFIGAGVWFHFHFDAIIRIPFVLGSFTAGVLIGAYCPGYLLKERRGGARGGL